MAAGDSSKVLRQLIVYGGVGALGTFVHYVLLFVLVEVLQSPAILASSVGAVAGAVVNYLLNFHWTFRGQSFNHRHAAPRFFVVALCGFFLNLLLMYLGTGFLELHYFYAQLIATAAVLLCGFLINKFWTFEE